jgi:predicted pyridoxine 5'-phosphate oxidase superfamily flavin-nucleotide-binding protein
MPSQWHSSEPAAHARSEEAAVRLTDQMKRVVTEQSLAFVATVRPDGTPAVSPKGTTRVRGDDQLVFLHLHSAGTVANLTVNPAVEVNVVDPFVRKGWRFAGRGRVLVSGPEFEAIIAWYDRPASAPPAHAVVLIDVERAQELVSPEGAQRNLAVRLSIERFTEATLMCEIPAVAPAASIASCAARSVAQTASSSPSIVVPRAPTS